MKISTKYNLDDKIYVIPLKIWGKILSIFIGKSGRIEYLIRFFNNFDPKEIYFLEEELSLQEDDKVVGFLNNGKQ